MLLCLDTHIQVLIGSACHVNSLFAALRVALLLIFVKLVMKDLAYCHARMSLMIQATVSVSFAGAHQKLIRTMRSSGHIAPEAPLKDILRSQQT